MRRRDAGQGMTEYIVVVALVAVAAIAIVGLFGQQLRANFYAMTRALAGHESKTPDKSGGADRQAEKKDLSDFAVSK